MSEERLAILEREILTLTARVDTLERALERPAARPARAELLAAAPAAAPPAVAIPPVEPSFRWRPEPLVSRPSINVEELLGGRLLALVGGVAFLLGVAFFVALAVGRGWIGIDARMALAAAASTALFAAGVWLYERRGQTQAALGMVGAAIAGLDLTLTVASSVYGLVGSALALVAALVVGAVATATAVRWSSRTIAGLGILGGLLAPALAESITTEGMLFLALGFAASSGVLIWRRWAWLELAAFAVAMVQIAIWVFSRSPGSVALLIVLSAFSVLSLAACTGNELRHATGGTQPVSALLGVFGALVLGALGYAGLAHGHGDLAGGLWIAALAAAHGALGAVALRARRTSDEIGLLLLGVCLALADAAFGLLAGGALLAIGWALSAAALALAARRLAGGRELMRFGLGAQLALAAGHALLFDAPPSSVSNSGTQGVGVLLAIVVAAFGAARLATRESSRWRVALDGLSIVALAYVETVALDGVSLVVAWALTAGALFETARRTRDRVAELGGLAFLGLATCHAVAIEAPPSALGYGVHSLPAAAAALALVGATCAQLARSEPEPQRRRVFLAALVILALYLGSVAIVSAFQPGPDVLQTGLALDVRQQGQVLLSGFWGLCGFAALWLGLRRDTRTVRLAGFGLLALAVGKVFLYDLSTLASIYRVASLVGLGLLLLLAALAYQRVRTAARPVS